MANQNPRMVNLPKLRARKSPRTRLSAIQKTLTRSRDAASSKRVVNSRPCVDACSCSSNQLELAMCSSACRKRTNGCKQRRATMRTPLGRDSAKRLAPLRCFLFQATQSCSMAFLAFACSSSSDEGSGVAGGSHSACWKIGGSGFPWTLATHRKRARGSKLWTLKRLLCRTDVRDVSQRCRLKVFNRLGKSASHTVAQFASCVCVWNGRRLLSLSLGTTIHSTKSTNDEITTEKLGTNCQNRQRLLGPAGHRRRQEGWRCEANEATHGVV
jgi:hypothetical protein